MGDICERAIGSDMTYANRDLFDSHAIFDGICDGTIEGLGSPTVVDEFYWNGFVDNTHCEAATLAELDIALRIHSPIPFEDMVDGASSSSEESQSVDPSCIAISGERRKYRSRGSGTTCEEISGTCDLPKTTTSSTKSQGRKRPFKPRGPRKNKKANIQPHKVVEARYRSNLKDKLLQLKQTVPTVSCRLHEAQEDISADELAGLQPARNLRKSTVLAKTIEYIAHLEQQNMHLSRKLVEVAGELAPVLMAM